MTDAQRSAYARAVERQSDSVYRLAMVYLRNPHLDRLGLRNCHVFYVPAVPAEYLVLQQADGTMPVRG